MVCVPRQAGAARARDAGRVGRIPVLPDAGRETNLAVGTRLAVRGRGRGRRVGPERGKRAGCWVVGREKGKEKRRGFGLGRKPKEKRKGFSIFKLESNKFSLNSNSNEFEFKLNNNNKTMQFSMSATQIEQTYLNFEKQPIYIFFYTKFHVKK